MASSLAPYPEEERFSKDVQTLVRIPPWWDVSAGLGNWMEGIAYLPKAGHLL